MPPIRTYHELTDADRSGLPEQIGAQRKRVAVRLATVGRVIAVMSGKGGVGKSYVTAHLARALARAGRASGVLDADLHGATNSRLLRIHHGSLRPTRGPRWPAHGAPPWGAAPSGGASSRPW